MKHFLSIEQLTGEELKQLVADAAEMKRTRGAHASQPLAGQTWAMIFTKSSTRTRVSFEVGVRELGGSIMFLSSNDIQLGRGEPIKDTARVLGRMVHGAIIRTFAQEDVTDFADYSGIPTINALTDDEHPCQIVADLLTIQERVGGWDDKKVVFLGDGDCNMARSWIWAAVRLGFELVIAAPKEFQPSEEYLSKLPADAKVSCTEDPKAAAKDAEVLYTDVWVSMGKEAEAEGRLKTLAPYQLNSDLLDLANAGAAVLHCLPAYREKEITEEVLEKHSDTIFEQAENRLHAQKAIMANLVKG